MSINFGSTSFGGQAQAPKTGLSNFSFGGATATPSFVPTATTQSFGGGGSMFGATAGSGFATNTSTAQQPFNFGGATAQPQQAVSAFSAGGFGTAATNPTSTTANTSFGFGGSSFGGFGGGATSSFGAPTTMSGFYGNTNTTGLQGLSSFGGAGFGAKPTMSTGMTGAFGMQQPQQPQQEQLDPLNSDVGFLQSVLNVSIFNDERDAIIARLNYLQALWGTGKSFFSQTHPPIDITTHNYLCRFKTMAYCKLPKKDNKMGIVALVFNKNATQLKEQQQQLISSLTQIFGNKPNLSINIDNIHPLSDTKCQAEFFIEERSQTTNEVKRILSTDVCAFLNQVTTKTQITNFGVEKVLALVPPDEDQLKEYLLNPPKGIDPRMWKQAQIDNPDSKKLIPVPIMGSGELKWRIKCQENETEMHSLYLRKIEKDLTELKQRHTNASAKIIDHRRRIAKLTHSILKIILKQETTRKIEESLLPEEEMIRSKLESLQALVIPPNEFKGRLNELVAQMKIHLNQWYDAGSLNEYSLDDDSSDEMKTFLTMQQNAMAVLIETVNKDIKALQVISEGINQLTPVKN